MAHIRVLQLVDGMAIGAESGGAELHALRIARYLDPTQFSPGIFSAYAYGGEAERKWRVQLDEHGVPLYGLLPQGTGFLRMFHAVWQTIGRFQPHIIHSHSERYDLLNGLICRLHPQYARAVRTVHIDQLWQTRRYLHKPMENILFPRLFSYQVAVSRAIYKLLSRQLGEDTGIALCHNGIDAAAFTPGFGEQTTLEATLPGNGRQLIGFIGRLTKQKAPDVLLAAFGSLEMDQPVHLLFVGDGPLRRQLEVQAEVLGVSAKTHFLGARNDVWAILNRLDLFVLPSRWEGFPTVLLEAMSQNVPVIASDIPGNRELIIHGETGLQVLPNQPELLAAAIKTLLDDPVLARRLAINARTHASNYTLQEMASCYESVYRQVSTAG